ncbi:NHL repeat-containing protein [Pseudomonas sp. LB3P93]
MTAQPLPDISHGIAQYRYETRDPQQIKFAAPGNAETIKTAIGNGRVFMAGWSTSPDALDPHIQILCIDSRGAWDKNFGDIGRVIIKNTNGSHPCIGGSPVIRTLAGGSIIAGANYVTGVPNIETATLLKFDALGFPVKTFGKEGRVEIKLPDVTTPTVLNDCHILSNGRILIAGHALAQDEMKRGFVAMLNPDGTLSSTFGNAGILLVDGQNADTEFDAMRNCGKPGDK